MQRRSLSDSQRIRDLLQQNNPTGRQGIRSDLGPSIEPGTLNFPEHPGTSNNYNTYEKMCKIKFQKIKSNKNKLVSARKIENKTKKKPKERKMKMTAMSEG